jgi:bifunctional DNA-binding transcriptional regulator/antitoxin component of YhaV-PrlF toxin-antitoxin module
MDGMAGTLPVPLRRVLGWIELDELEILKVEWAVERWGRPEYLNRPVRRPVVGRIVLGL